MYILKLLRKIVIAVIIFIVCGITYNFFVEAYHRVTIPSGKQKVYLITIYTTDAVVTTDTSYKMPEINSNYIKYLDLNGNINYYNNFKVIVTETTEDNNNL